MWVGALGDPRVRSRASSLSIVLRVQHEMPRGSLGEEEGSLQDLSLTIWPQVVSGEV